MINRRVSLFYRHPLKAFHHMVCPYTLDGGWSTPSPNIHIGLREWRLSTVEQTGTGMERAGENFPISS